eukprot:m.105585 g.105585  ORF g.105585 m.105585 type:complete len:551 (-) comp27661_c0_seq1:98-1750(-)
MGSTMLVLTLLVNLSLGITQSAVDVMIDTQVLQGKTYPEYISFNLEFPGVTFNDDKNGDKVTFLAKQLAPSYLRLGGNSASVAVYKIGRELECKPHNNSGPRTSPGVGMAETCFTLDQLNTTTRFVRDIGGKLIFDLNEYYSYGSPGEDLGGGPRPQRAGPLNLSNAADLLESLANSHPDLIPSRVTLGNELPNNLSPNITASDFRELATLLKSVFNPVTPPNSSSQTSSSVSSTASEENQELKKPLLMGTDAWWNNASWVERFFAANPPDLAAYTYHMYLLGEDVSSERLRNHTILDSAGEFTQNYANVIIQSGRNNMPLWLTETGAAWGGAIDMYGPKFVDGFWFVDQLGLLATRTVVVQHRHALVGSWGPCFIGPAPNFIPRPDFFTAVIWKRLVGEEAFGVKVIHQTAADADVRVYAHCQAKASGRGLVLIAINLGTTSREIKLNISGVNSFPATAGRYWLSAPDNNMTSDGILLNDKLLQVTRAPPPNHQGSSRTSQHHHTLKVDGWVMPSLMPTFVSLASRSLQLPALGYGFFTINVVPPSACS